VDDKIFSARVGEAYLDGIKKIINNSPVVLRIDKAYYRPTEVELLMGDPTKAKTKLGWKPKYDLQGLIEDMINSDLQVMKKERHLKDGGYKTFNYFE
jgi:GDPmannose 4,6-dehydratase